MIDFLISKAIAADQIEVGVEIPGSGTNAYSYDSYVCAIYNWSLIVGTSLAVLMMIFAGYKYLVSQGNPNQINDAKEIIYGAIIGFILLVMIRLLLRFFGGEISCI